MESLLADVRFGMKLLWKQKAFSATALATLAICLGASTSLFSVVHSVVLRPLPFPESDRVLVMYNSYPNAGVIRAGNGVVDYLERMREVTAFEEQALYSTQSVTVGERGAVEQTRALGVTPSLFRLLRVRPSLGRLFTDAEMERGRERCVILSHTLWQQRFGGDPAALGKTLRIYGNPYVVVGVMPADFVFLDPAVRLWRPLSFTEEQKTERHSNSFEMIGRLRPGASLEQAQAQIDALNVANLDRYPEFKQVLINARFRTRVLRLDDDVVASVRTPLVLLWAGATFVLLIGAVNVANLATARSNARARELATRLALGARRARVVRQMITENVVLALVGACVSLPLSAWGARVLGTLGSTYLPRSTEIALRPATCLYTTTVALLIGLAIGLIPAARASRLDWGSAFRDGGRASTGGRAGRLARSALMVAQLAFALVLLSGAGLLLASFRHVLAVKPGFVPDQVLTASVALPSSRYPGPTARRALVARALEQIRAVPGVAAAGATDIIPFGGDSNDSVILAEDYVMKPGESLISPNMHVATPGYFAAMRIPIVAGRDFTERDSDTAPRVIIVDERLAKRFWPGHDPIGKRMWRPGQASDLTKPGKDAEWFTVVGVVASIKLVALVDPDERPGAYYFPLEQRSRSGLVFAVRSARRAEDLSSALRRIVTSLDPELPLFDVKAMTTRIDESLTMRRSPMLLALAFGAIALLLSAIGVYGVLAYAVAERTREIGIRLALGSSTGRVVRLLLRDGLPNLGLGLAVGLAGTLALTRFLSSVLYGIRPLEPTVAATVSALLASIAVVACLMPARRATRIDPVHVLRQD